MGLGTCLVRPDERKGGRAGSKRKLRMHLDPAQYYEDMKVCMHVCACESAGNLLLLLRMCCVRIFAMARL